MSDDDLARETQAGSMAAFEELVHRYEHRIYAFVMQYCHNDADAREITQDAFVRAWERLGTFRGESLFGTWLHRLAVNVALNWRKSAARARHRFDDEATAEDLPGRRDAGAERMDLDQAIGRLPPGARQVFVLHDVEGFRHGEIATLMGVTEGTSKAQLHRARMLLRDHLER